MLKKKWLHSGHLYCIPLCHIELVTVFFIARNKKWSSVLTKARKISAKVVSWQQKGKNGSCLLIFPVYKDMHYFFLVSMSSSSSAPVNVFSWSYPAVTEHYKVFHASMRKSINQLVLRAHDTCRWHGSGFRPRSASSKLSANMKKV